MEMSKRTHYFQRLVYVVLCDRKRANIKTVPDMSIDFFPEMLFISVEIEFKTGFSTNIFDLFDISSHLSVRFHEKWKRAASLSCDTWVKTRSHDFLTMLSYTEDRVLCPLS